MEPGLPSLVTALQLPWTTIATPSLLDQPWAEAWLNVSIMAFLTSTWVRLRMLLSYLPTLVFCMMGNVPCLSRITGKLQLSCTARNILFATCITDQRPEFVLSNYKTFYSSSSTKILTLLEEGVSFASRWQKSIFSIWTHLWDLFQSLLKSNWMCMTSSKPMKTRKLYHWTVKVANVRSSWTFRAHHEVKHLQSFPPISLFAPRAPYEWHQAHSFSHLNTLEARPVVTRDTNSLLTVS